MSRPADRRTSPLVTNAPMSQEGLLGQILSRIQISGQHKGHVQKWLLGLPEEGVICAGLDIAPATHFRPSTRFWKPSHIYTLQLPIWLRE